MTPEERFYQLSEHRRSHIERVVGVMDTLSRAHHLDQESARLAGWGHDLARELSRPALLQEAQQMGIPCDRLSLEEPVLLHGPIAAEWLKRSMLGQDAVYEAIYYHTTAHPHMGDLAKALFIADGVEPGRKYTERDRLYRLALENLDAGFCAVIEQTLTYLQSRGITPHPHMLATREKCI